MRIGQEAFRLWSLARMVWSMEGSMAEETFTGVLGLSSTKVSGIVATTGHGRSTQEGIMPKDTGYAGILIVCPI